MRVKKKSLFESEESSWSDKFMSVAEWTSLSVEQREIHYKRVRSVSCPHEYVRPRDPELVEPWSFDPYAHTAHMDPCTKKMGCACQMCAMKIGQMRAGRLDKPGD